MKACEKIQSIFPRLVEGEAEPEDALRVARHLGECTVCKIVLARERRLAEALGQLDDPIPVDERFLDNVMAALPSGPPPTVATPARRRLIRLAGAGVLAAAAGFPAIRLLERLGAGTILHSPTALGFEDAARLLGSLGGCIRSILLALVGDGLRGTAGALPIPSVAAEAPAALGLATVAFVALAALSWLAAWSVRRPGAPVRASSARS